MKTVTYVLFTQGVHKLGKNFVGNDSLGKFIRVVGKSSKSKGS